MHGFGIVNKKNVLMKASVLLFFFVLNLRHWINKSLYKKKNRISILLKDVLKGYISLVVGRTGQRHYTNRQANGTLPTLHVLMGGWLGGYQ